MRKQCPRCKSLNTQVVSPRRMACRNCRHTWVSIARASSYRKDTQFVGDRAFPDRTSRKNHSA